MALQDTRRALVVAPHPDDEVLGPGGTIARLADAGCEVHVAIVTNPVPHLLTAEAWQALLNETHRAHAILGVKTLHLLDVPTVRLDTVPHAELNRKIGDVINQVSPDILFVPFQGDLHIDHQLVFNSCLVGARPNAAKYPQHVWAYETLSETNWNAPYLTPHFQPTLFVDIEAGLDRKLEAMKAYKSQVRPFPAERSIEAIGHLARLRGATVHRQAAEAFVIIREVL